jgi:hypothetical protein
LGWTCIFAFCHVPWIIAIFLVGVSYRNQVSHLASNSTTNSTNSDAVEDACNAVGSYMLGFFIIYCVNIVLGLIAAIARNVDESNNICARQCSIVIGFTSVVLVCYNIYGVIVVWSETLWGNNVGSACVSLRILCVAVLSFFLLLPVLCFGLLRLRGGRTVQKMDNVNIVEEQPVKPSTA